MYSRKYLLSLTETFTAPLSNKYSYSDNGTAITPYVHFIYSQVKKEIIDDNTYTISFNLVIKDDEGNLLELKPGSVINGGYQYLKIQNISIDDVENNVATVTSVTVNGKELNKSSSKYTCGLGEYVVVKSNSQITLNCNSYGTFVITVSKTAN